MKSNVLPDGFCWFRRNGQIVIEREAQYLDNEGRPINLVNVGTHIEVASFYDDVGTENLHANAAAIYKYMDNLVSGTKWPFDGHGTTYVLFSAWNGYVAGTTYLRDACAAECWSPGAYELNGHKYHLFCYDGEESKLSRYKRAIELDNPRIVPRILIYGAE